MARARELGDQARTTTSPRPWVGAVVADAAGGVVGEGWTQGRDGPHAEVVALDQAGGSARGGTLWCTLEPCSHHGLTPPCAEAVVAAGIGRVVVAVTDPDPQVAGGGFELLRSAGIEVVVGPGAEAVEDQLAPYLHHRRTGRPLVVLKSAATLDGRTAAPDGSSRWITGEAARADAHRLRAESDAVLVGAGTVRADDPELTVRLESETARPGFRQPLRVVLGEDVPAGARVHPAVVTGGELTAVLDDLGGRGVLQVLVEGGATVAGAFHRSGLVDRYVVYLAPALFGGEDAPGLFRGPGAATMQELWRGHITGVTKLGPDLRVDLVPRLPTPVSQEEQN